MAATVTLELTSSDAIESIAETLLCIAVRDVWGKKRTEKEEVEGGINMPEQMHGALGLKQSFDQKSNSSPFISNMAIEPRQVCLPLYSFTETAKASICPLLEITE